MHTPLAISLCADEKSIWFASSSDTGYRVSREMALICEGTIITAERTLLCKAMRLEQYCSAIFLFSVSGIYFWNYEQLFLIVALPEWVRFWRLLMIILSGPWPWPHVDILRWLYAQRRSESCFIQLLVRQNISSASIMCVYNFFNTFEENSEQLISDELLKICH